MAIKEKISLDELNKLIADPTVGDYELQRYFIVDEAASGPFNPALALNPDTVEIPSTSDGRVRSAGILNAANYLSRQKRRFAFSARTNDSHYKGPILVSEGDSWFQYPFKLTDVIDKLMEKYAIFSLDAAGDTLSNMLRQAEYMDAIQTTRASIFLFSAGGNDVVAGGNLAAHLHDFDPARSPVQHLKPSFGTVLDEAIGMYSKLVRQVSTTFPNVHIISHGYDYVIPASGPWLGKPMATRGITDATFQRAIARTMIDRFNERLALLQNTSARLTYIDLRNTVGEDEWFDELHPTNDGYAKVAEKFADTIQKLATKSKAAPGKPPQRRTGPRKADAEEPAILAARAKDGPVGRSLHIGLNAVDPTHYAGWSGPLAACEFDADDMNEIAKGLGYDTTVLLTQAATREKIIDEIGKAAQDLNEGDIFFVSYSGHGGQLPDFNGDEEVDRLDETWCLYDGQLIDDELYELWSKFKSGVRVLVLSDSCHSGSVVRATVPGMLMSPVSEGVRAMPDNVASRTFRQNRDFYTELGREMKTTEARSVSRAKDSPISCSVRLISGCQDNQESLDGIGNGAFTAALINVWDHGRFRRNYSEFHKAIQKQLPNTQSPNHWSVGPKNPVFDAQPPFAI